MSQGKWLVILGFAIIFYFFANLIYTLWYISKTTAPRNRAAIILGLVGAGFIVPLWVVLSYAVPPLYVIYVVLGEFARKGVMWFRTRQVVRSAKTAFTALAGLWLNR